RAQRDGDAAGEVRGQLLTALIADGADDDVVGIVVRRQFGPARPDGSGEKTQLVDIACSFESDLVAVRDDEDLIVGPEEGRSAAVAAARRNSTSRSVGSSSPSSATRSMTMRA